MDTFESEGDSQSGKVRINPAAMLLAMEARA
jgi:hypothetical protein